MITVVHACSSAELSFRSDVATNSGCLSVASLKEGSMQKSEPFSVDDGGRTTRPQLPPTEGKPF